MIQSGKSIFLRSIDDPSVSKQYTQHTAQTTVARFSPSGFYVASGDVSGAVKVWDCAGEGATKGVWRPRGRLKRATGDRRGRSEADEVQATTISSQVESTTLHGMATRSESSLSATAKSDTVTALQQTAATA